MHLDPQAIFAVRFFLKVKHSYWYSFRADGPQQPSPNTHAQ